MCVTNNNNDLRQRRSPSPTSVITSDDVVKTSETTVKPTTTKKTTTNSTSEKTLLQKLFSDKEEKTTFIPHMHKTLGLACLISFVYRFANLGPQDGNFGPTVGTVLTMALHWFLNASSFIFKIPERRIRDGGYRIWPEYRIHSLVFASRHLALMALLWYEQMNGIVPNSEDCFYSVNTFIVLATCALADYGSSLGKERHNTVRGVSFSDPYEQWFASEQQVFLTAFCVVGYRRYMPQFLALMTIQLNSFFMTLRRKNAASQQVLTALYSGLLLGSAILMGLRRGDDATQENARGIGVAGAFGGLAVILRMGLRLNKYVLWAGMGLLWWFVRTNDAAPDLKDRFYLHCMCLFTCAGALIGLYKRSQQLKADPKLQENKWTPYIVIGGHAVVFTYLYLNN